MKRDEAIVLTLMINEVAAVMCIGHFFSQSGPNTVLDVVAVAVIAAQGSLLAIWAAFAGKRTAWRFAVCVAGSTLLSLFLQYDAAARDAKAQGFVLLTQMIAASVPLMLARLLGLEVRRAASVDTGPETYRFQFSLRSMLEWTTAIAILLSMLRIMPEEFRRAFLRPGWYMLVAVFSFGGLAASASVWIALAIRGLHARSALLVSMVAVASSCLFVLTPGYEAVGVFPAVHAAWLVGTLLVFRYFGYELVWRRRTTL